MRDQILALVTHHCDTIRQEASEIAELMSHGAASLDANRAALESKVHKLKGGSGTIGFVEISSVALQMELVLREDKCRPLDPDEVERLQQENARLQAMVRDITPDQSTLYVRFV